jgi:hypothetical protein
MALKYSYNISTDFPNQKVNSDSLIIEIDASSISVVLEYILTDGASDSCDIWFESALSSAEETTLDGIVAAHQGNPPDYDPDQFEYWQEDPIVTDYLTGKSARFSIMQALINRREIFNDDENPVYMAGHVPLIGSGGSVTNLNNIHGKLGWHNQEVQKGLYQRPKDLLIYYGYLNSFNSAVHGWDNQKVAKEMAQYGVLVFGDGLQNPSHPDYANTQVIIPRIKALNPSALIFGYVTVNQSLTDFQTKVDQWNTLGVHGIFLDEAGYDYGTTTTNGRDAFNAKVDYVHGRSSAKLAFANSWNMDHIIGTANDTSYPNTTWNPDLHESKLTADDWYLLESFCINTTSYTASTPDGYEPKADWAARGVKAQGHRATYGINLAAVGIINDDNVDGQDLFDFQFVSGCMWSLDAVGTSSTSYGASTAQVKWWTRPDVSKMGPIYSLNSSVQVDVSDADVYWGYVQTGKFMLDFSDSAQDATATKW